MKVKKVILTVITVVHSKLRYPGSQWDEDPKRRDKKKLFWFALDTLIALLQKKGRTFQGLGS
jgi:hypothetical protein